MSTLNSGPVTQAELVAAGYTLTDGSGERVQLWTGTFDDGLCALISWDSTTLRKITIPDNLSRVAIYRGLLALGLVLNDAIQASSMGAGAKAAAQTQILNALRVD